MANVVSRIDMKCRVSRVDPVRPKKETYQYFENYEINTQVIDEDEWWLRTLIAWTVLKYGTEWL